MKDDSELFESPLLLLAAAKEDVSKAERLLKVFIESSDSKVVEQLDSKTSERVYKLCIAKRIPGEAKVLVYRALNDLRHALDQAVCDGSVLLGATTTKNTYFPFASDAADFERQVRSKCKFVNVSLVDFIRQLKPYYGGNDMLWALSRICGPNKHERILHIGISDVGHSMSFGERPLVGPVKFGYTKWNDRRNELEFARVGPGGQFNAQVSLAFEVVIGSADVVAGQPVIPVLNHFASEVERIILGIKAEAERIVGMP